MASCVKCGKYRLHKDREGRFRCRICGPRQIYRPQTESSDSHPLLGEPSHDR